ncbi:hypothetical protein [Burkholderia phage FLC6]|nr:hypothetical protein [Burkholderia phage FLC6]
MAVIVTDAALTPEAFDLLTDIEKSAYITGMSFLINSEDPANRQKLKDFLNSGIMKSKYDAYVESMGPISMKPMPHAYWFAVRVVGIPKDVARELLGLQHKQINEREV